jgi:hypothetical protein
MVDESGFFKRIPDMVYGPGPSTTPIYVKSYLLPCPYKVPARAI